MSKIYAYTVVPIRYIIIQIRKGKEVLDYIVKEIGGNTKQERAG